jgi:hypothetical protein
LGKSVALGLGSGFREWSLPVVGGGKRGKGKREEVGKEKVRIREERERERERETTENMITTCTPSGDWRREILRSNSIIPYCHNAIEEANGRMAVGLGNQP